MRQAQIDLLALYNLGERLFRARVPPGSYLIDRKVDTLILAGTTTSGCIRATAVDGFSYNYYVVVPEECAWDRGEVSHKINLFDIQEKYGDVRKLEDVLSYLDGLEDDLYAGVLPHVAAVGAG